MKTYFIILVLLVISPPSWSQRTIKTVAPCSDDVLFKTPGKWFTSNGGLLDNGSEYIPLNRTQVKETTARMDAVRDMLMKIYPEPIGVDAAWHHAIGRGSFGEQVRYVKNSQDILNREAIVEKPVAAFGFFCGFFPHYCSNNPNEIWSGYPGETGTWFGVSANTLRAHELGAEDAITIGGYPVCLRQPLIKTLGDYELLGIEEATAHISTTGIERLVIVHRKGMLPYIPVTRKQYLDQCIPHVTAFWNTSIKSVQEMPAQLPEEKETRDELLRKTKQEKDEALKAYRNELEETTKEGLLDAPAIVSSVCNPHPENMSIFVGEREGWMLVIHNPDYMRKDLPKYVPQFFVVWWKWDEWKPQADIAKLIEEEFPLEKLQVMIDN